MTTDIQMDSTVSNNTVPTFNIGDKLRAERVKQGFDERDIASQLKIPTGQIRALESNDFNHFRSATFARGFLKSYCRLLNLDHADILAAFDIDRAGVETTIKPVDKVNRQSHLGDPIVIFISIVIVAVLVFLVFWWPSSTNEVGSANKANNAPLTNVTAPKTETPIVSESASVLSSTLPGTTADSVVNVDENNVDARSLDASHLEANNETAQEALADDLNDNGVVTGLSAETKAILKEAGVNPNDVIRATTDASAEAVIEPQPKPSVYSDDILVAFSADCWTEVRDSTGRILYSGVKSAGQELTLTGKAPYRVVLGYADGVTSLLYKGDSFDFSSFIRKGLARFELK
ncbi:RodZ domain-containing protein [Marinomonas sp. IMCC 4694]|uniref:RodZ domain-containing protein n=1 Tax=Marinomonas sp. IMCC 4694 TaxID=2605432 RepID=UPI0021CCD02D|nr:RodZ domain-containing protein [Marinomonas sp. IMCC 4694]